MSEQLIGRFEILSEIGHGGMAVVYLARDPKVNRQVALKVLPRQFAGDPLSRERFKREAEVIGALEHPCIVPMYEFGEYDEQLFIAMRYMSGGSLVGRLKGDRLPLDQVEKIVDRVSMALDEAHSRQIVHRDLKPGNVLFDGRGDAYLSDFGIVKMEEGSSQLTGSGILGTPAYMSPEQGQGNKDIDGRSDVYALGLILYEMLAGKPPFFADTPVQLVLRHILEPMPAIAETRQDLPAGVQTVLDFALAKDRTSRYQTAGLLSRDLRSVLAGGVLVEESPTRALPTVEAEFVPPLEGPPTVSVAPIEAGDVLSPPTIEPVTGDELPAGGEISAPAAAKGRTGLVMGLGAVTIGIIGVVCLAAIVIALLLSSANKPGRIAFVSGRDGNAEIYVMDADGTHLTRLTTNPADDIDPAWSPDGTKIAFASKRDGNLEIYVMNADGSNQARLTDNPSDDSQPAWSADPGGTGSGSRIAFASTRDDPNAPGCQASCDLGIFIMKADGSGVTRLANHFASSFNPAWSGDPGGAASGTHIAFSVVDGTDHEIYTMRLDPGGSGSGSDVTRLTNTYADPVYNFSPAWSPDGKRIVFATNRDNPDKGFDIYVMNSDGTAVLRLTKDSASNLNPGWSPDGKRIVFDSIRDDPNSATCGSVCNSEVYVINVDGTGLTRLTNNPAPDGSAVWKP